MPLRQRTLSGTLLLNGLVLGGLWEGFERGVQAIIIRLAGSGRALREEYKPLLLAWWQE